MSKQSCNISIAPGELLLTHLVIGLDVLKGNFTHFT